MGPTDGENGVVVPAVASPSSVTCIRSLGKQGVHTVAVSENGSAAAFRSRYCDESIVVTSPHDDLIAYKDALLNQAKRPDVSTIIPVREEDIFVLAKFKSEFAEHVGTPWPSLDLLELVQDRVRLFEVAREAGVPAPETQCFGVVDDWSRNQVIKSRYNILVDGYGSVCTPQKTTVNAVKHLSPGEVPDEDAIRTEMGHEPIVQEFVPTSDEYMIGALYDHGEPLATFQHRQVRGDSYTGGGGVYRKSVYIPELERVSRELLGELDWHGLACIEYMRDEDTGEFKLTEINPRMWQSLASTVRTGADFPYYYWLQANDRTDEIDHEYELGVGSHLLRGELVHLLTVVRDDSSLVERPQFRARAWEILASCLAESNFDYFRVDDPMPFVQDLFNIVADLVPE